MYTQIYVYVLKSSYRTPSNSVVLFCIVWDLIQMNNSRFCWNSQRQTIGRKLHSVDHQWCSFSHPGWIIIPQKCVGIGSYGFHIKWIISTQGSQGNWKKSKFWRPFWSYQLNSTANSANLAQFWGKWAGLAVLFSW